MASLKVIFALALLAGIASAAIDFSKSNKLNVLLFTSNDDEEEGCGAPDDYNHFEPDATLSTKMSNDKLMVTGYKVLGNTTLACKPTDIDTVVPASSSSSDASILDYEDFFVDMVDDYETQIMTYNCTGENYGSSSSSSSSDDSMVQLVIANGANGALATFYDPRCNLYLNLTATVNYKAFEFWACDFEGCGLNGGVVVNNFTEISFFGFIIPSIGLGTLILEDYTVEVDGEEKKFTNEVLDCVFAFYGLGYALSCVYQENGKSVDFPAAIQFMYFENGQNFISFEDENGSVCFLEMTSTESAQLESPSPNFAIVSSRNYSRLVSFALGLLVLAFGAQAL